MIHNRAGMCRALRVGLLATAALLPMQASAQAPESSRPDLSPSADNQGTGIDTAAPTADIIITAEKRRQPLSRVPTAITAITGEEIEQRGLKNFADYVPQVPSLSLSSSAPGEQNLAIRGVSDTALSITITQKTAGVHIDEMVVSNNRTSPDLRLFDIERIEVLRGPQGTLYGDGAIGGLIRIVTNKPDLRNFDVQGEAGTSFTQSGGFNYELNGMLNIPLLKDQAGARLVGYYADLDGFIDNVATGKKNINDEKTYGGRAALKFEPTSRLSLTANLLGQRMKLGARNIVQTDPKIGSLRVDQDRAGGLRYDYLQGGLTAEYDAGPVLITYVGQKAFYERRFTEDSSDLFESLLGFRLGSSDYRLRDKVHSFAHELRLASSGSNRVDWILGAYYFKLRDDAGEIYYLEGTQDLLEALGLSGSPLDLGNDIIARFASDRRQRQLAGFGELTFHANEKLDLIAGARVSRMRQFVHSDVAGFATQSEPFSFEHENEETVTTPRFKIAYRPAAGRLFYASVAKGYRIGGVNNQAPTTQNEPGFKPVYQPDSLWAYEVGSKIRLGNQLNFSGALFYNEWKDVQVVQLTPSQFGYIANGGRAHTYGTEMEAHWRPSLGLDLFGNVTILRARLTNDNPGIGAKKGDRLPGVAEFAAGAGGSYSRPIGPNLNLVIGGDATYVGKQTNSFDRTDDRAGNYVMANLRAGVETDRWEATLFVKNVTNTRGPQLTEYIENVETDFYRRFQAVPRPRTIGATVRLKY